MSDKPTNNLRGIAERFDLKSDFVSADRYGSGHINDSYVVNARRGREDVRFFMQRIDSNVFKDPAALMDNVERVTRHLGARRAQGHTVLSLVPAQSGDNLYVDEAGEYWRVYHFLEGTRSFDTIPSTEHARAAAAEFGTFLVALQDLPGPRLHETIPDFHNTPARYVRLKEVIAADSHQRVQECRDEIEQALAFEEAAGSLVALQQSGAIPERVTHNDTKLNNVMFDRDSTEAVCVVDLDTVMLGLSLHDFGDMVRTATVMAEEDEQDLSKVKIDLDYFEALAEGFIGATNGFLNTVETDNLAVAGKVITVETGVRFLTDYLSGDTYFKTHRPGQNLDRCRMQFALAASIDDQLDVMQAMVTRIEARQRVVA